MLFSDFEKMVYLSAKEKGCDAAELMSLRQESLFLDISASQVDKYQFSDALSIGLQVQFHGKSGYASTEVSEDPETLVLRALENAKYSETSDLQPLQGPCQYPSVPSEEDPLNSLTAEQKIELAMKMEETALQADPDVMRMSACSIRTNSKTFYLSNSLGLHTEKTSSSSSLAAGVIVRDQEEMQEGYAVLSGPFATDGKRCAEEAVQEALSKRGSSPVTSGSYRILLRNDAASSLLAAFFPLFAADSFQKGLTTLGNNLGKPVAASCVSITDNPLSAASPRPFDAEGVPSVTTAVVQNGVLTSLLHNLKTAKKAHCMSTSNAVRSIGGPPSVGPSDFYIHSGSQSLEELIAAEKEALLITDVSGLHAGVNVTSGEFSLLSQGFLIQNGTIQKPVSRITIGGNFMDLLQNILAVGSDQFSEKTGIGGVSSPSLLIQSLVVAGKDD